jgi:hypothetical protein
MIQPFEQVLCHGVLGRNCNLDNSLRFVRIFPSVNLPSVKAILLGNRKKPLGLTDVRIGSLTVVLPNCFAHSPSFGGD